MVYNPRIGPDGAFVREFTELKRDVQHLATRPSGNIVVRETLTTVDPDSGVQTIFGQLADGTYGIQEFVYDITPPPVATMPSVVAEPGVILVSWDGLFEANGELPRDFECVNVIGHKMDGTSTVSSRPVGIIRRPLDVAAIYPDTMPVGETWQFSLESEDRNSNRAVWGLRTASVTMQSVVTDAGVTAALEALEQATVAADTAAGDAQEAARLAQEAANEIAADLTATNAAVVAAQDAADQAASAASSAAQAAGDAQTSANGKNTTWYTTTAPAGTGHKTGDSWFDADDNHKLYTWDGTQWVTAQDSYRAQQTADSKALVFTQSTTPPVSARVPTTVWNDTSLGENNVVVKYWNGTTWSSLVDKAATDAQTTANTKGRVIYSTTEPAVADRLTQNLWIDTTNGVNISKRWSGSAWVVVADQRIADTIANLATLDSYVDSVAAQADRAIDTFYGTATPTGMQAGDLWLTGVAGQPMKRYDGSAWQTFEDPNVQAAYTRAGDALAAADAKVRTFAQAAAPTGLVAADVGDLWIDTDDNNKIYRWDGSAWQSMRDLSIANAAQAAADALQAAQDAQTAAESAQAVADGAIRTFYQSGAPTGLNNTTNVGDLWFDTDDGQAYRWNGTAWVIIEDNSIAAALKAAQDAQTTADGKITSYYQPGQPTTGEVGDIWFDTDDKNKPYYCSSIAPLTWTAVRDGAITDAQTRADNAYSLADAKNKTYYQTAQPSLTGNKFGDVWYDTDDRNKPYVWNGSAWASAQDGTIAIAQSSADAKVETWYQATAPTGLTALNSGDLWIDSDNGQVHRYTGSAWVLVNDNGVAAVNTKFSDLGIDQTWVNDIEAQTDKAITTFFGTTTPTGMATGDLWLTGTAGDPMKRYSGTAWVTFEDPNVQNAYQKASDAEALADSKIKTYASTTAPTGLTATDAGDLWINTTAGSGAISRWSGSAWQLVTDNGQAAANKALGDLGINQTWVNDIEAQADRAIDTFFGTTTPTGMQAGDLWLTGVAGESMKRYNGTAWVDFEDPNVKAAYQSAMDAQEAAAKAIESARSYINPLTSVEGIVVINGVSPTIVDSPTAMGGKALRKAGTANGWYADRNAKQAFDPTALYRITTRIRVVTPATTGGGTVYVGVQGYASNGTTLVNANGADSTSSQHYLVSETLTPTDGTWKEYVLFFKGNAVGNSTGGNTVLNPRQLHNAVRYFEPIVILDYSSGNGVWEVSHWSIDVIDAAGHQALVDASTASNLAKSKIRTFAQTSAPTGLTTDNTGDLWINTTAGAVNGQVSRWTGSAWTLVVESGTNSANAALTALGINQTWVDDIEAQADRAIDTFFGTTTPTGMQAGDLWLTGTAGDPMKRYDGTTWVTFEDPNVQAAYTRAGEALTAADEKVRTFAQTTAPTGLQTVDSGDLWINTSTGATNGQISRWTGSAWALVTDNGAAAAAKKTTTYYQPAQPSLTGNTAGDIWFDTDDQNKVYVWNGAWTSARDAGIDVAIGAANGKNTNYYQTAMPTGGTYRVGDLWIDTDDGNKLYTYNGTTFVSAQDAGIATAQASANGKNKVHYATTAASGTVDTTDGNRPFVEGDTWFQRDGNGFVIGHWEFTGGAWVSRKITGTVLTALDAHTITVNQLRGTQIEANAIDVTKLSVSDFTNLLDDPIFSTAVATNPAPGWVKGSTPASAAVVADTNEKRNVWRLTAATAQVDVTNKSVVPVNSLTDGFYMGVRTYSTLNADGYMRVNYYTDTMAFVSYQDLTTPANANTWTARGMDLTVPTTARFLKVQFIIGSSATTGSILFSAPTLRRKNGGELIVDGAIDGKTISGALIQTDKTPIDTTASRGIKLTTTQLVGYDTAGNKNFALTTAGALTLKGAIQSGSTITGTLVTGSDGIQTSTSATAGVKLTNTGIKAWDSSNNLTFHLDAATGYLELPGLKANAIKGDMIEAGAVDTMKLRVGDFTNLITNGLGELGTGVGLGTGYIYETTDKPAALAGVFKTTAGQGTSTTYGKLWDVTPNTEYIAEVWLKADLPNSRFYAELRDQAGAHGANGTVLKIDTTSVSQSQGVYLLQNTLVPTVWTKYEVKIVTNATTTKLKTGSFYFNHPNGTERGATIFFAMSLRRRVAGSLLVDGAITSNHMVSGTIEGGVIKGGTITGTEIASKTIKVDNLVVSSTDNLVVEGAFEHPTNPGASWTRGTNQVIQAGGGRNGGNAMRLTGSTSTVFSYNLGNKIQVDPDNRFRVSMHLRANEVYAADRIRFGVTPYKGTTKLADVALWRNSADSTTRSFVPGTNVWTQISAITDALPADTTAVEFWINTTAPTTTAYVDFDSIFITRAADGNLVVDGAMDAKTITGAFIRTAVTGARIEMDGAGLRGYSSTGTEYLTAGATGISVTGVLKAIGTGYDYDGVWINGKPPERPIEMAIGAAVGRVGFDASWSASPSELKPIPGFVIKPVSVPMYSYAQLISRDGEEMELVSGMTQEDYDYWEANTPMPAALPFTASLVLNKDWATFNKPVRAPSYTINGKDMSTGQTHVFDSSGSMPVATSPVPKVPGLFNTNYTLSTDSNLAYPQSADPGALIIDQSGVYDIAFNYNQSASPTARSFIEIQRPGETVAIGRMVLANGEDTTTLTLSGVKLTKGDKLYFQVYQQSGAARTYGARVSLTKMASPAPVAQWADGNQSLTGNLTVTGDIITKNAIVTPVRYVQTNLNKSFVPNATSWGPGQYTVNSSISYQPNFVTFGTDDSQTITEAGYYTFEFIFWAKHLGNHNARALFQRLDNGTTWFTMNAVVRPNNANLWEFSLTRTSWVGANTKFRMVIAQDSGAQQEWDSQLILTKWR